MNQIMISLDKDYSSQDVSEIFNSMFSEKLGLAQYKANKYAGLCLKFEKKHNIKSGQFASKFESGEMGDDPDFFDWFAAKKGFDIWNNKISILKGLSIK